MTALTEFLFPAPARRNGTAIFHWWEKRRLAYNGIVGATGLISLVWANLVGALPPEPHPMALPVAGVLVVGVLANICYCLGPAAEIAIEKLGRGRVLPTGPALYRMGLTFSVGLMLLPTLLVTFEWGFRILRWLF